MADGGLAVTFFVPLCPFEQRLLDGIRSCYASALALEDDSDALTNERIQLLPSRTTTDGEDRMKVIGDDVDHFLVDHLFQGWKWAARVVAMLRESQGGDVLDEFGGDMIRSLTDAIHWLKSMDGGTNQCLFRTKMLYDYNPGFPETFVGDPPPNILAAPPEEDLKYWDAIIQMSLSDSQSQLHTVLSGDLDRDSQYDVWKVVHQFSLSCRRPGNAKLVEDLFMTTSSFLEKFTVNQIPTKAFSPDDTQIEIVDRQAIAQMAHVEPEHGADGELSNQYLHYLLSLYGASRPLEDPRCYVEMVPWEELESVTTFDLENEGIDITLPYSEHPPSMNPTTTSQWKLWKPQSFQFFESHHFHPEDEVYQYCVVSSWHLPGHSVRDRVIFRATRLEDSEFVNGLRKYWEHWNDCCLTFNAAENQLYVLETIPGIHFRIRQRHHSEGAALTYFRDIVEQRVRETESFALIKSILGDHYQMRYEHVLRYIDPHDVHSISTDPLGEGENGAVYGATWTQPPAFLCTMQPSESEVHVVLKQVHPKFGEPDGIRKTLRELDITFQALVGAGAGCVTFLGVTAFAVDEMGRILANDKPTISDVTKRIFFVFQRASEGSLLAFLHDEFKTVSGIKSWMLVVDTLSSIAGGLDQLHRRGIVHGDVHPGNIVVTKQFYPNEQVSENKILLIDLGEGSRLSEGAVATSGSMYKIGPYMPPEVEGGCQWSTKVDVYSFGVIAKHIIHMREQTSSAGDADNCGVPTILEKVLENCLSSDPNERPDMKRVALLLEDLEADIKDGKAEWAMHDHHELPTESDDFTFLYTTELYSDPA